MKITAIEKKKGSRYQVDVDGEYWYILDIEIIYDFHLAAGMEVEEAFLEEVKEAAEYRKAKERALYLLEIRDYGKQELLQKLAENVSFSAAKQAVERMEELGLLNDELYLQRLTAYLSSVKHYGARRIRYELQKKGFSSSSIEDALQALFSDDEDDELAEFVRRKYSRYLFDEKGRKKVLAALGRLGYSYGEAASALERAASIEKEET